MATARQQLGNYVFQLSGFCVLQLTANHSPQQRYPLYIALGWATEKIPPPTVPLLLTYYPCACMCIPHTAPRQQLSEHISTTRNTTTTEELLNTSFSMWCVLYQRKPGNQFFPEHLVSYWLTL
jgi:hypothetical protein